jgi:hypothetical protein
MAKNITELKLNEVQNVTGGVYATMSAYPTPTKVPAPTSQLPAPTGWSAPSLPAC